MAPSKFDRKPDKDIVAAELIVDWEKAAMKRSPVPSLTRPLARRDLAAQAAALGLAAVTLPALGTTARAAGPVNVFTWSGYELPLFYQEYAEAYGEVPSITFFGGTDEALAKVRSGFQTDVMHPCSDSVRLWHDAGVIRPIDPTRLEHWNEYFPTFRNLRETQTADGQPLFIPFDWGNSSVLYRTDLVEMDEESWSVLYDERYAGRVATYDQPVANVQIAALVLGYSEEDIWHLSDDQLAEVRKLLQKQRDLLRFIWTSQTEALQALASGEIVAMYAWNDAYAQLRAEGVPVAYMQPKEGARNWICGLVLSSNPLADDDRIYAFLNSMMRPEAGAYLIDEWGYGAANMRSYDLVSPERLEEVGLTDPDAFLENGIFLLPLEPEYDQKYVQLWEEVQAGM